MFDVIQRLTQFCRCCLVKEIIYKIVVLSTYQKISKYFWYLNIVASGSNLEFLIHMEYGPGCRFCLDNSKITL